MVAFCPASLGPSAKVFVVCISLSFDNKLTRKPTSMTAPLENQGSSPTGAEVPGSSKETDKHTPSSGSEPKASPGPTFFWPLLLGAISIVVAYFLTRKNQQTLPEVYALCSEQGNSVYTVDYNNNKAQCVVVNGSNIADIGSLGEWYSKEK